MGRSSTSEANNNMKGILLAGGTGSRLFPATIATSKQLLAVAGKPLVAYPLCTLMEAGIREVCIITTTQAHDQFVGLLGDGSRFGMKLIFRTQLKPNGLPEAFLIAKDWIGRDPVTLILGDNIFIGLPKFEADSRATIYAIQIANAKRYGVVTFDERDRILFVREKPKHGTSRWAVAGLYSFGPSVIEIACNLRPSARGELEIVDVITEYHLRGQLRAVKLPPAAVWLDAGTPSDLVEATNLIHAMEKRTGEIIGSPEIVALRQGWITPGQFDELVRAMPECAYKESLCESQNRNQNRASSPRH